MKSHDDEKEIQKCNISSAGLFCLRSRFVWDFVSNSHSNCWVFFNLFLDIHVFFHCIKYWLPRFFRFLWIIAVIFHFFWFSTKSDWFCDSEYEKRTAVMQNKIKQLKIEIIDEIIIKTFKLLCIFSCFFK